MKSRFPTFMILITATTWAGFAAWLGVNPTALLTTFGLETSTPQILTEIRAFYGGVELAIAVAMIVLWQRGQLFASLLVGGLPLVGSAAGRCFGMIADGFSGVHAGFALLEFIGAVLCLAASMLTAKTNADE